MTKKHFIALADSLRASCPHGFGRFHSEQQKQWSQDVSAIADFCAEQNPNFNRERWIDYIHGKCGPSGGKI